MTINRKEIDSYAIQYVSQKDAAGNDIPFANIHCFSGNYHEKIGTLIFLSTTPLPANFYDPSTNMIHIFFGLSIFYDIIDILRNEKPLSINFDDANFNGWLSNGELEPVGQQEKS